MIFKKSDNALLFSLIIWDFSWDKIEQVLLTSQKLEIKISKAKYIASFRKSNRKTFRFGDVKMIK